MCAIRPQRAAEAVAEHIETLILEGALRPGQPLLPERDLAGRLNVSRPTLRDGLKLLTDKGLLTGTGGRGLRVAELGRETITDPLVALLSDRQALDQDYLEFRDIVESQAAALAALRATDLDHDHIRDCLARIDAAHDACAPADEAGADAGLHQAIYEATHNLVLLQIMRALSRNLRMDVLHNRERLFALAEARSALRDQHHAIARAILARDPEAARQAAHDHLAYVRECLRQLGDEEFRRRLSARRMAGGGVGSMRD